MKEKPKNWYQYLNEDAKEKAELAQYFINCYISARQGLKKLGILRTERYLQADYAEWIAKEILNLKFTYNPEIKTYVVTDKEGNTYHIKSRMVKSLDDNTSFDFQDVNSKFDYMIGIFFSPTLDILGIIRVPYNAFVELGSQTQTTFRFRWNKQTAKDSRVEWLWKRNYTYMEE